METTRIALVQMQAQLGKVTENLQKIACFVEEAASQNVDIICFPELCVTGYSHQKGAVPAESVPGKSSIFLSTLAQINNMIILAGLAEENGTDKPFISQLVAFPGGNIEIYRKTHLGGKEAGSFMPGDQLPVFSSHKVSFGIEICWDAHFPEVSTVLAVNGCEIIFVPHASPQIIGNRREIWLKYLPARAYDNAVYVAACNLVGGDGSGKDYCGGAMLIDPRGNIAGEDFHGGEGLLVADLDPELTNNFRRREARGMSSAFFLRSRRPGLYGDLLTEVMLPMTARNLTGDVKQK